MKNLTLLLLTLTLFTSCRKEFASFQKSSNINYAAKKKNIEIPIEVINTEQPNPIASTQDYYVFVEPIDVFRLGSSKQTTQKIQISDDGGRKKQKNTSKKLETFFEKKFPSQRTKDTKISKKRQKPVELNSSIYTGFIILGIAILLSLVSLNSLSLLFGVAAILFLYLGFKKYFRKKRRRDIFR